MRRQGMTRPQAAVLMLLGLAEGSLAYADDALLFGSGVDLVESTAIADILANPDVYLGRRVRIDGGVIDVCPRKGCWIEIGDQAAKIQVKVEDHVIVFPTDAKGRVAAAQGVVEAVEMEREEWIRWLEHEAEEHGVTFDADTAGVGQGPFRLIRIRGTGARIESP